MAGRHGTGAGGESSYFVKSRRQKETGRYGLLFVFVLFRGMLIFETGFLFVTALAALELTL